VCRIDFRFLRVCAPASDRDPELSLRAVTAVHISRRADAGGRFGRAEEPRRDALDFPQKAAIAMPDRTSVSH
jgi:hypothetical protein